MAEPPRARRTAIPSEDPVYSEADVAEMRMRWEQADKDRRVETQLATLVGQYAALPDLIRSIARETVISVLAEKRQQTFSVVDKGYLALMALATLFIAAKQAHVI